MNNKERKREREREREREINKKISKKKENKNIFLLYEWPLFASWSSLSLDDTRCSLPIDCISYFKRQNETFLYPSIILIFIRNLFIFTFISNRFCCIANLVLNIMQVCGVVCCIQYECSGIHHGKQILVCILWMKHFLSFGFVVRVIIY